jgi:hypothetical protein
LFTTHQSSDNNNNKIARETVRDIDIEREKVVYGVVKGKFLTNLYGVEHPLVASLFLLLISRRPLRKR